MTNDSLRSEIVRALYGTEIRTIDHDKVDRVLALISQSVIEELEAIPNFELPYDQANAVNHIVDRIQELKTLANKGGES